MPDNNYKPRGKVFLLPENFTEDVWVDVNSSLCRLSVHEKEIILDATRTVWSDPIPLLSLSCMMKSKYLRDNKKIVLKINHTSDNIGHKRFLKFLYEHGFFSDIDECCLFFDSYSNRVVDKVDIRREVIKSNVDLHIENAKCISAKIVSCSAVSAMGIDAFINRLLEEAAEEVSIKTSIQQSIKKDHAIQKLRNLLRELVENVVNHAYPDEEKGCVGIFARIRRSKNNIYEDKNNQLSRLEKKCILIKKWNRDYSHDDSVWIELFVVDTGCGLLSSLNDWKVSGEDERRILNDLLINREKSPLRNLMHNVFSGGFSSSARGKDKTVITGLQLVYESLKNHTGNSEASGDFIRLMTGGEVLASHVPFPKSSGESACYKKLSEIIGTNYHAAVEISPEEAALPKNYHAPTNEQLLAIRSEILGNEIDDIGIDVVDQRHLKEQGKDHFAYRRPHSYKPSQESSHVVWLPPESIDKHDIKSWLEYCIDKGFKSLTIADIPVHRAYMFDFIVSKEHFFDNENNSDLDVYIITRSWWVSHYSIDNESKYKRRFKMASGLKRASLNLDRLCRKLRECDSKIFWENISSDRNKSFLNKIVEWTSKEKESFLIEGYVDFGKAISDKHNYKLIKAAYERTLALWSDVDFVTTDDLLSPIAHDLCFHTELSYLSEVHENAKKKVVLIGSVKVTGDTNSSTNRVASRQPNVEIIDELYVLVHKSSGDKNKYLRMLDWDSSIEIDTTQESCYKRIDGTPFVKNGGLDSYQIIKGSDTQSAKQMYSELTRGYLKLGHWDYSGSHDLFTINLSRVVSTCHESTAWIAKHLEETYDELVDNLLVYISHPVTQKIVSTVRDQFGGTLGKYIVFPLQKVNIGISQQTFFSPLVLEEIENISNRTGESRLNIVLLDDGIISGKTLRDAQEALFFEGKTNIKTIVLLDRSGYPSTKSKLEEHSSSHKSFWRWDMPSMGNKGHCPLCACIDSANTMERSLSDEFSKQIRAWIASWKCKRVVDIGWDITGHDPIRLTIPYDMAIGRPYAEENHFEHINSTTLSSMAIEISRSTLRVDFPLEKFYRNPKPEKKVPIAASIEAICTHLLMLGDAIPLHVQLEYYIQIIRSIWFIEENSNIKSLASLKFFCMDELLAPAIWDEVKKLIIAYGFLNIDCQIVSAVIYQKYSSSRCIFDEFEEGIIEVNIKAREAVSLLELLVDKKRTIRISNSLNRFFRICGEGPATTHEGELDVLLNSRGENTSSEGFKSKFSELLNDLSQEIKSLEKSQCISNDNASVCINYLSNILSYIDKLQVIGDVQISSIYGKIFKNNGIQNIWDSIVIQSHQVEDFIYEQIVKFNSRKKDYISEKGKEKFCEKWDEKFLPEITVEFDEGIKDFSPRYLFLSQARKAIYDILCNSIYAKHGVVANCGDVTTQAIFVSFKRDYVEITFKNLLGEKREFDLVPKSYMVILQQLGGNFETRFYDFSSLEEKEKQSRIKHVYEAALRLPSVHAFRLREHMK